MKRVYIYIVIALCGVSACTSSRQRILEDTRLGLVDKHATDLTAILFHNLKQMTGKYVVYGQHNYEMDGFNSDTSRLRYICQYIIIVCILVFVVMLMM